MNTQNEWSRFKSSLPISVYHAKDIKGPQMYPKIAKAASPPTQLKSKIKPNPVEVHLGKNSYRLPKPAKNPSTEMILPVLSSKHKSKTTLSSFRDTEKSQEAEKALVVDVRGI